MPKFAGPLANGVLDKQPLVLSPKAFGLGHLALAKWPQRAPLGGYFTW